MALEWRGNNLYFYDKERDGGKVRSVYAGKGETALLFHWMREDRKREKEFEKQRKNKEIMQDRAVEIEIESILDSFSEIAKVITDGFFLTNGFHQHKRQWRKKRNER